MMNFLAFHVVGSLWAAIEDPINWVIMVWAALLGFTRSRWQFPATIALVVALLEAYVVSIDRSEIGLQPAFTRVLIMHSWTNLFLAIVCWGIARGIVLAVRGRHA